MINRDFDKRRNKGFFYDALQTLGNHGAVIKCLAYGRDWMGFDQGKKIHLYIKHMLQLKKNLHTLYLFSSLSLGLENCFVNKNTFSRIQDPVRTL